MKSLVSLVILFCVICIKGHHVHIRESSLEESKIIGGSSVHISAYPSVVHLQLFADNIPLRTCVGTILNTKHILTAAQCLLDAPTNINISVGSEKLDGGKMYSSSVFKIHPQFNKDSFDYDAGVITVDNIVLDGKNSKAVKLPRAGSKLAANTIVDVLGWGPTGTDGQDQSSTLKGVKVPVVDFETCQSIVKKTLPDVAITPRNFCAADLKNGGKDACTNDAGGPAMSSGVQVGIVSWGMCGQKNFPGIYLDVAAVLPWLKTVAGV